MTQADHMGAGDVSGVLERLPNMHHLGIGDSVITVYAKLLSPMQNGGGGDVVLHHNLLLHQTHSHHIELQQVGMSCRSWCSGSSTSCASDEQT